MDFFTKLGETITATGKDVSQKAKDLTGLAKLNIDIRTKEEYILRQYTQIGEQYYNLHKEDAEPFFEEMALVTETKEEIEKLKQEISELKGIKKCPSCGTEMEMEAVYCTKCGAKYDSIFEEEDVQKFTKEPEKDSAKDSEPME